MKETSMKIPKALYRIHAVNSNEADDCFCFDITIDGPTIKLQNAFRKRTISGGFDVDKAIQYDSPISYTIKMLNKATYEIDFKVSLEKVIYIVNQQMVISKVRDEDLGWLDLSRSEAKILANEAQEAWETENNRLLVEYRKNHPSIFRRIKNYMDKISLGFIMAFESL